MEEFKMFEIEQKYRRWINVNNLNGIIERPDELATYLRQGMDAGEAIWGKKFKKEFKKTVTKL